MIPFLVQYVLDTTHSLKQAKSMNMNFNNKLNGLITNKYKYKNRLIIIFIIKKQFIKDTEGTQLNPPWQSRITNRQQKLWQ